MKAILTAVALVVMMVMAGTAAALVEEDWPLDTPNTHVPPYILIDFDDGVCKDNVTSLTNMVTFDNDGLNPWIYACKNCTPSLMNIYDPANNPNGRYVVNGNCGAWCNIPGHSGNISFENDVCYVSVLVSTYSGLCMDAYNSSGALVATSGLADGNIGTLNFTRVSVDREECDISSICIHDTGNYWLIDDLLVSYVSSQSIPATISIGDAFDVDTVPIMVTGADNVGSVDVTLTYDASIVTVTGVTGGEMDSEFWNLEDNGAGEIRIGAYQANNPGLNGDFVLVNVSFAPVTDGLCPFGIDVTTFKDATPIGVHMSYYVSTGNYSSYMNGDVNGDGAVDMFDVMYLAKNVIGLSGFGDIIEATADVNGDGIIDIDDAKYLAKHIIGMDGYEELK